MDSQALWLTLRLALTTTALLLAIALPVGWWIASGNGPLRALVQSIVALPLVLPPTVLGFYLLVALGPLTAPGRLIIHLLGHPLAFSFSGLVIGSILYSLPFAVQPLVAGFRAVDPALLEVASTLGASPLRVFTTITLPLAKPSLLAAAVLTFTHTVGEFGVVLMLGGNIPGATRTLSIALYDQVQDFNYAAANRTAELLLLFSLLTLLAIYWRGAARRPLLG
ncbi:MAG TPA: molybdate ABC transporter permease subunit [Acidobacteriaceae bacterium]|nr:molybdate ABC transporter permease subunit [Acidobacteriaceae bacterium]